MPPGIPTTQDLARQKTDAAEVLKAANTSALEEAVTAAYLDLSTQGNKLDELRNSNAAKADLEEQRKKFEASQKAYQDAVDKLNAALRMPTKKRDPAVDTIEEAREFQTVLFYSNFFVTPAFRERFRVRLQEELAKKEAAAAKGASVSFSESEVYAIQEDLIIKQYQLAKTLDERVKHRGGLIEPLQKEFLENLNGIRAKLNAAGGIYRQILDPKVTPAVIEERVDQVTGDAVDITIQVTPITVPTLETIKDFKGAQAAAPTSEAGQPTVGLIRKTTARVAERWTFDIGPSVLVTSLTPREYYLDQTSLGNIPREKGYDQADVRTGLLFHYYQTRPQGPGLGLTLGVTADSPTQILVAPVVVFGRDNRLAFSLGAAFGHQDRLTSGQQVNRPTSDTGIQTRKTLATGLFAALTITLNVK